MRQLGMKNKYLFVAVLLAVLLLLGIGLTKVYVAYDEQDNGETVEIVTSFYPMYIAAMNIVGDTDGVQLTNLSEPQTGCLHDYQLTPADMKLLSSADVFVVNGGGIEAFLADVAAEYEELAIVEASCEVELLSGEDRVYTEDEHIEDEEIQESKNAHAWMSITDYMQQVQTIADGLCAADLNHAAQYQKNAERYLEKLETLKEEADELKEILSGKQVVIFHEAYEYVADEYGMEVAYVMNLDEERQISAGEVADLLTAIDTHKVTVVLAEEQYGREMGNTVERESSASVYYMDPLVRGSYDADSYIEAMEENIQILKEAFTE